MDEDVFMECSLIWRTTNKHFWKMGNAKSENKHSFFIADNHRFASDKKILAEFVAVGIWFLEFASMMDSRLLLSVNGNNCEIMNQLRINFYTCVCRLERPQIHFIHLFHSHPLALRFDARILCNLGRDMKINESGSKRINESSDFFMATYFFFVESLHCIKHCYAILHFTERMLMHNAVRGSVKEYSQITTLWCLTNINK